MNRFGAPRAEPGQNHGLLNLLSILDGPFDVVSVALLLRDPVWLWLVSPGRL